MVQFKWDGDKFMMSIAKILPPSHSLQEFVHKHKPMKSFMISHDLIF